MVSGVTTNNLRRIWDRETRRGANLTPLYPGVRRAAEELRDRRRHLAGLRRTGASEPLVANALEAMADARKALEDEIWSSLEATAQLLRRSTNTHRWGLRTGRIHRGKTTYKISTATPTTFFSAKSLENELALVRLGGSRPRSAITKQFAETVDDGLPKAIIRLDVDNFFESVPHEGVSSLLRHAGMGRPAVRAIETLLGEYASLVGSPRGLPRGVGISSRLADAYLSGVDRRLRMEEGVIFSARYVDDIMIVTDPAAASRVVARAREALTELELSVKESKTEVREALQGTFSPLTFLGYEFQKKSTKAPLDVRLPDARTQELKRRIDRSFEAWDKADHHNTGRQGLLLRRIRLLTGNYRLEHNRRRAIVGIYFSYPLLNDMSQLGDLDRYLANSISGRTWPTHLEAKLRACSFVAGFTQRTFWSPTSDEIKKAVGAWRATT